MPGKKKKYNARFPPARIKKIMQSDEDVGKVAAPVPVIISRALELFSETLLLRAKKVTAQRGARTLTPSHLKFCIQSEKRFDFLKDLVSNVAELQGDMDSEPVTSSGQTELRHVSPHVPTGNRMSAPGLGRGRGHVGANHTRPVVPGTGKRRGRPPKALGAPPSARTKRPVLERFVDDEYDVSDVKDDTHHPPHTAPPMAQFSYDLSMVHPQHTQLSQRLSQPSSSPLQRSDSQSSQHHNPAPAGASPFTMQVQETPPPAPYQRTHSLPPAAPVFTPGLKTPPALTPIVPKVPSWSLSLTNQSSSATAFQDSQQQSSNGHSSFKAATNGSFSLTPLLPTNQNTVSVSSPLFSSSTSQQQELDEDYDC